MAKTEIQIERDFYGFIKQSTLAEAIRGDIYRRGMRPNNAKTEDIIVKYLGGIDEQIQAGTVVINIYVPYIPYQDGRRGEDLNRIGELQEAGNALLSEINDTDYYIAK